MASLLDRTQLEPKLGDYAVGSAAALADPSLHPMVQDYRRRLGSQMYPLERGDITKKIPKADCFVSRKIDGEFTALIWREGTVLSVNPGGVVRTGLVWQDEAARLLQDAGVKQAVIAGELYVQPTEARRPRVHDVVTVARNPQSQDELARLRFAPFDIMSFNGQQAKSPVEETVDQLHRLFGSGERVCPPQTQRINDPAEITKLFARWVEDEGEEGLIVRSDFAGLFKVKPRHNLDAVVIGFTESTGQRQGLLHDILVAVRRPDEAFQVLTRIGGGFSEDERREMLSDLKDLVAQSEYAEVNGDHVAYQMVRPEWVVELSCLDLISQNTRGGPISRMTLDWDDSGSIYRVLRRLPLCSVISPQFVRRREDKSTSVTDIRIAQVSDRVDVPWVERNARQMTLPGSELLRREVYTKASKGQTMVRKFVMWKTNKETHSDEFPAYVIHCTDYSPGRKNPLARDIRVSDDRTQVDELWQSLKDQNLKRGWDLHCTELPVSAASTGSPGSLSSLSSESAGAHASNGETNQDHLGNGKTGQSQATPSQVTRSQATRSQATRSQATRSQATRSQPTKSQATPGESAQGKSAQRTTTKKATAPKKPEKNNPKKKGNAEDARMVPPNLTSSDKTVVETLTSNTILQTIPAKRSSTKKTTTKKTTAQKTPERTTTGGTTTGGTTTGGTTIEGSPTNESVAENLAAKTDSERTPPKKASKKAVLTKTAGKKTPDNKTAVKKTAVKKTAGGNATAKKPQAKKSPRKPRG